MGKIAAGEIIDHKIWEKFIAQDEFANFLQSSYWGDFQEAIGRTVYRRGLYEDEELVGVYLVIVEPARRARYLAIPGGPILNWANREHISMWMRDIKQLAQQENCAFVRVRPQLLDTPANQALFDELGFRPAQMHLHAELTSQLDITKDEDELRKNMRKNTRYELKQAKKKGIRITVSDKPEDIKEFYEVQLKTATRHGFVPYSYDFLFEQFKVFSKAGKALLYSSHTKEGDLVAQAFVIFYNNEAAYHYGASTELGRKEPGAYLVQWKAILEAKKRGMKRYNFWGVVRPDETKHRFYGVSVFKRGFRGDDIEYLHARDLVISWPKYTKNLAVEYVRKRIRRV